MYRPSIKSTPTLVIMAVVAIALYLLSEFSRVDVKAKFYEEKILASEIMRGALEVIREHRAEKGVFNEEYGDPLAAVMIGQKYSIITTEEGLLASKLTALNPNFAAAIVEMLKEAGIGKGDKIAVAMTGSFPGLNIALLSACKVLGVEPVIISSLGSSSWGANDEDFTWLDIESLLRDRGIFEYKSVAASLGGGHDSGFGLSQLGRKLLQDNAEKHNVPLIEHDDLNMSIDKRLEIYGSIDNYSAYVNIGGGIASLGHPANSDIIDSGLNLRLMPRNYPGIGVINHFGARLPIIHLANIDRLRRQYDLPLAPDPLPQSGTGTVFVTTEYDLRFTVGSLAIIAVMLLIVFRLDKQVFKLSDQGIDPESL